MDIKKNQKLEEFNTNKLLIVFVLAFIGIFGAMYLHRFTDNAATFMMAYNFTNYATYITSGLTLLFGLKWILDIKKKKNTKYQYFSAKNLFFVFATTAICFLMAYYFSIFTAVKYIYMFLCAIAASYFVLVSLPLDVYFVAVLNIINLGLMNVLAQTNDTLHLLIIAIIFVIMILVSMIVVNILDKKEGVIFGVTVIKKGSTTKFLKINNFCLSAILAATLTVINLNVPYLSNISFGLFASIIYVVCIMFAGILNSNK